MFRKNASPILSMVEGGEQIEKMMCRQMEVYEGMRHTSDLEDECQKMHAITKSKNSVLKADT